MNICIYKKPKKQEWQIQRGSDYIGKIRYSKRHGYYYYAEPSVSGYVFGLKKKHIQKIAIDEMEYILNFMKNIGE